MSTPLSKLPYKGARDFFPEDKRLQKYLFGVMRAVVERFGYEEYDAPILEPFELYAAKSGAEIVNEQTYVFKDRGDRTIAIRPEMTPTVSRMVAARQQTLTYPLRWYSIPNLWRYERPQHGRLREHWQLNVDLFGVETIDAELEMIQIMDILMKTYGATSDMYTIKLNSRKLINYILKDYLHFGETQAYTLSKLIDHKNKIPHAVFVAEADAICSPSQREQGVSELLQKLLETKSIDNLLEPLSKHDSAIEIKKLISLLNKQNVVNVEFDMTLMRGFDYYTDIVFEVFDTSPTNKRAMFGGGRYDGLVGLFGGDPIPTIGFGMGDVTLNDFLDSHNLMPALSTETDIYVILIGDVLVRAQKVIDDLREMGLNVAVDFSGRKADKQIKTALKKGIQYAVFIGERELDAEQYKLKNLKTGKEESHSVQRIVSAVKDFRSQ